MWDLALNSREFGGLEIGSLEAFDLALLYKWRWRFLNESDTLWVRCIKWLYGDGASLLEGSRFPSGGGV